jgi:hypothetical protein
MAGWMPGDFARAVASLVLSQKTGPWVCVLGDCRRHCFQTSSRMGRPGRSKPTDSIPPGLFVPPGESFLFDALTLGQPMCRNCGTRLDEGSLLRPRDLGERVCHADFLRIVQFFETCDEVWFSGQACSPWLRADGERSIGRQENSGARNLESHSRFSIAFAALRQSSYSLSR